MGTWSLGPWRTGPRPRLAAACGVTSGAVCLDRPCRGACPDLASATTLTGYFERNIFVESRLPAFAEKQGGGQGSHQTGTVVGFAVP